ncbi:MAG: protein-L-isoaspartate(D-aspartate) O-methyltransferase [Acidobacteria bacterium]|nr:protein-L-isoaspartate(D-aspartate) O-methyltransferase [Acidobacteriota bacterium]
MGASEDHFYRARARMIERLRRKGIRDEGVLRAMLEVPRHRFVEEALQSRAQDDHALPIKCGQTISQPYMVARMTELLGIKKHQRVLEVGAGSGYQTAILARLAGQVFAIERIPELAELARSRLERLGILNVVLGQFDGTLGWAGHAPYDAVLVAAAAPSVPEPLIGQLATGGVLVMPIGDEGSQRLVRVRRESTGNRFEDHGACVFVKLIGEHSWKS